MYSVTGTHRKNFTEIVLDEERTELRRILYRSVSVASRRSVERELCRPGTSSWQKWKGFQAPSLTQSE